MLKRFMVSFSVLMALSQGPSVWAAAVEVPGVETTELRNPSMRLQTLKDKLADYKEQYTHVCEKALAMNMASDLFMCISSGGKLSDLTPDELKVTADAIAQLAAQRQTAEMCTDDSEDIFSFPLLPYANDKMVILHISLLETTHRFSGVISEERLRSAKQCALEVYKARWRYEADDSNNPELPKQYNQTSDFDRFDNDVQSFLPYVDAYFKDLQTRAEADEKENSADDGAFYVVNKGGIITVCIKNPKWTDSNHLYFVVGKDGCMEPFEAFLEEDTLLALVVRQQGGGVYRITPDPDTGFKKERIGGKQETFAGQWRPKSEEEDKTYFWTDSLIPGPDAKATIQHSILYTIDSNGEVSPGTRIPPVSLDNVRVTRVLKKSGYLVVDNDNATHGVYNVQTGNAVQGLESFTGKILSTYDRSSGGSYGYGIWNNESSTVTLIPESNDGVDMDKRHTTGMTKIGPIFVGEDEEEGHHDKFQLDDGRFFVPSGFEPKALLFDADPCDEDVLDELGPFDTPRTMLSWLKTQEETYKAAEAWIKSVRSQKSGEVGDGTAAEQKGDESEESDLD